MNFNGILKSLVAQHSFSIPRLVKKFEIPNSGVLHVGANFGQEADLYDELGFENVYWIEGYPVFINKLKATIASRKNHHIIEAMVSDISGEEVNFSVTSNTGSSTLLEPTEIWHKTFNEIKIVEKKKIICKRLDEVLEAELDAIELKKLSF